MAATGVRFPRRVREVLLKFKTILADPPWAYREPTGYKDGSNKLSGYSTPEYTGDLSTSDLCELDVASLADRDCVLFLWTTNPFIPDACQVMEAWGFKYKTAATWVKTTIGGKLHDGGVGTWFRGGHEPLLVGVRGNPSIGRTGQNSVFMYPKRGHSMKPDGMYYHFERYGGPRLELFSRTHANGVRIRKSRDGWLHVGSECDRTMGEDIRDSIERLHG